MFCRDLVGIQPLLSQFWQGRSLMNLALQWLSVPMHRIHGTCSSSITDATELQILLVVINLHSPTYR